MPSPSPAGGAFLNGVAAISATVPGWSAGAAAHNLTKTLILHWNGKSWTQVPSPSPGGGSSLSGVAATSASNAWAVGTTSSSTAAKTLILRWNGKTWK